MNKQTKVNHKILYLIPITFLLMLFTVYSALAVAGDVLLSDTGNGTISNNWQGSTFVYSTDGLTTINITSTTVDSYNMSKIGTSTTGEFLLTYQFYDPGTTINNGQSWSFGFQDKTGAHTFASFGSGVCNQGQTSYREYSDDCGVDLASRSTGWHNITILLNFTASKAVYVLDGVNYVNDSSLPTGGWNAIHFVATLPDRNWKIDNLTLCDTYCPTTEASITEAPTFVSPTPANNTKNSTQITINVSSTTPNARYYLWFGNISTPSVLVLTNSSTSTYTTSITNDGTYYYIAQAWSDSGGFSANSTKRQYVFDNSSPIITLNPTNSFTANNVTNDEYLTTLPLNITFTDNIELYAHNITIYNSTHTVYNSFNGSILLTTKTFTDDIDVTTFQAGYYTVAIEVSDTHTLQKIENYDVTTQKNGITFDTEYTKISLSTTETSILSATKTDDRYSFTVNYNDNLTKTRTYTVTSLCPIYEPKSKIYPGHLITSCGGVGGNWIDFTGETGAVTLTKINDYQYTVSIQNVGSLVTYKSIGGLNVREEHYSVYIGETPQAYTPVGLFNFDLTSQNNIFLLILFIVISLFLIFYGLHKQIEIFLIMGAAFIFIIGFILLFNDFNKILSLLMIIIGFVCFFMEVK